MPWIAPLGLPREHIKNRTILWGYCSPFDKCSIPTEYSPKLDHSSSTDQRLSTAEVAGLHVGTELQVFNRPEAKARLLKIYARTISEKIMGEIELQTFP